MKAEHRKELQTNALADRLGKAIQGIKEGPSRGTVLFIGVIAAAILLYGAFRYFANSSEAANSARWLLLDEISSTAQLDSFVKEKDVQDTMPGRVGRFQLARTNLLEGIRKLGFSRSSGIDAIQEAATLYEKLIDESSKVPLLQQQALMGAAKANEALGDLDKARGFYQKLAQSHKDSVLGKEAEEQLTRLGAETANKDLAELVKEYANPK
jgi:hypothetical protein